MASLKEMRNQIASVKATQKITKAMQMVAAAKLRRAQEGAEAARPYATRMSSVIANLASGVEGEGAPRLLVGTGSEEKHVLVVATSDRGLAGGFNSSIARAARDHYNTLLAQGKDVRVLTIGKKATAQLKRVAGSRLTQSWESGNKPSLALAQEVGQALSELFDAGQADVVTLFYSRFKSVVQQVPTARGLIPAEVADSGQPADLRGAVYEYEPDPEAILEDLLPRNVSIQVYSAMLENQAGFYAAQMAAMDNATRNAGDMIGALTIKYNRTRQAQITKELIEIISGAEAL